MTASIHWLDLTSSDRDKVRRILDLFSEQGTVDELGLGSLRDALSDALFPGTSVLHTRLRYVLFIPWLYRQLEQSSASSDIVKAARRREIDLIGPLSENENDGIIGIQARESLARLPSSVYWAALSRWGIFTPKQSLSWYHTHFDELRRELRHPDASADDPGILLARRHTWHPRLPSIPADFPEAATFALSHDEAEFIQAQIRTNCDGSLLAWLAEHHTANPSAILWEAPEALSAPRLIGDMLELARQFSLVMEGAPLLYNLMLAEKRVEANQSEADMMRAHDYREEIADWMARARADLLSFRPEILWAFVDRQQARSPEPQRRFVERWLHMVSHGDVNKMLDDQDLRSLIELRERQLKGPHRARLANLGRLTDWRGRVGVGRMVFRWTQVRRLLIDLHDGLVR
ncbi:MAG: DUF6361 family protein [Pseudohongiellaceae bacterium]